ncbi:hypothetical protein DV711_14060 [Motiliproteus coralliicola]|uniref:Uncharacterized protein n=1 Tax=Motiliproteus coralliicola TaxID=2283196 RepID=A0A369WDP8_9GAMM|nr:hypothetical protein DV711_14060 [Motiliproteus coralliicola]
MEIEQLAENLEGIMRLLLFDEGVPYPDPLTKYEAALNSTQTCTSLNTVADFSRLLRRDRIET